MYSPKIKPELVKKLYQLKLKKKQPMTALVNEAVEQYLTKKKEKNYVSKNHS